MEGDYFRGIYRHGDFRSYNCRIYMSKAEITSLKMALENEIQARVAIRKNS